MSKLETMIAVSFSITAAITNQMRRSVITASGKRDQLQQRLRDRVQQAEDDRRLEQIAPVEPIVMSGNATRIASTIALATNDQNRDCTRHMVARFYAAALARTCRDDRVRARRYGGHSTDLDRHPAPSRAYARDAVPATVLPAEI